FIIIPGHSQAVVHRTNVSALHVFEYEVQPVEAWAQRHGLLINGLQFQRLLEQAIREVAAHGLFKGLYNAAGKRGHAAENIDNRRVDSFFGLERKLVVGNLDGDGNQHGVVRNLEIIGAPVEVHLVADDAVSHYGFQVLELDLGWLLNLGKEFQAVELIH